MDGHDAQQPTGVELTCIPGGGGITPEAALGAWGTLGERLWPAWSDMMRAELSVYEALGEEVGQKLLVLWAISRFRDSELPGSALSDLVDEAGAPLFGDPLVEDMMLAAFALGAAWAGDHPADRAATPTPPRLRVASSGHPAH